MREYRFCKLNRKIGSTCNTLFLLCLLWLRKQWQRTQEMYLSCVHEDEMMFAATWICEHKMECAIQAWVQQFCLFFMLFVLQLCLAYNILVEVQLWSLVMWLVMHSEQQGSGFAFFFSDIERHLPISLKLSGIPCCYFSAMNTSLKFIQSQHSMLSFWNTELFFALGLAWFEWREHSSLPVCPAYQWLVITSMRE